MGPAGPCPPARAQGTSPSGTVGRAWTWAYSGSSVSAEPSPGWHMRPCLQKGWSHRGVGVGVSRREGPCCYPLPHPGSRHPRRVEPKGVLSPPALMPCPICPLVHPLKQSLAFAHVQGRGAHFLSRPQPIWGQKACPSAGAATAPWPPSPAQTVFAFQPCLKHP